MASETKVSICSSALVLLGQPAIAALTEDSDAARTCAQLYDNLKATLVAAHPWNFSKKKVQLVQSVTAPISGWTYQYAMPTDRVGDTYAAFPSEGVGVRPTTAFDVQGSNLLTDHEEIWLDYQYNTPESLLPQHFVQLLIYVLASNFAEPVTEVTSKAEYWHVIAYGTPQEAMRGGFFRVAVGIDGRGKPNQVMDTNELIDVRQA